MVRTNDSSNRVYQLPVAYVGGVRLVNAAATARLMSSAVLCRTADVTYSRRMSEDLDDTALMLRYRDGDVSAFELLYRRHNDSLFRYLLRMSMSRESAEDIYQDVWRKIIDSRQRYRPSAKFSTFLYRIARNCFIDHKRRNKRYSTGDFSDVELHACEADSPDIAAETILMRRRLNDVLAELPVEQRDAFLLHEEAGLDLESIAYISNTSRETVKSRLRYANNKLKQAVLTPAAKQAGRS